MAIHTDAGRHANTVPPTANANVAEIFEEISTLDFQLHVSITSSSAPALAHETVSAVQN
jgi:hypothetical protein